MDKARATFLAHASHQLFTESPTTSAHLSFQHLELQQAAGDRGDRLEACRGCGTLSVPGTTNRERHQTLSKKRDTKHQVAATGLPQRIWTSHCLTCGRDTKHRQVRSSKPSANRPRDGPVKAAPAIDMPATATEASQPQNSTSQPKISSKKRAQARQSRAGLQALLNRTKSSTSGPKLGFTDLMKK